MNFDTIRLNAKLESVPKKSHLSIRCCLEINGGQFYPELHLDLKDLAKSCQSTGEFFVFTCGCGEPGCAGIFEGIEVTHAADRITWICPKPMAVNETTSSEVGPGMRAHERYSFESAQYIDAINHGIREIKALALASQSPVEYPVYGVHLHDLFDLEASAFTTHLQEPERRLIVETVVVDA